MITFKPEPLEALKKRFPDALKESYSVAHVRIEPGARPGDKPQHVFDSEDGIRLIISRDYTNGKEYIHFSASVDPTYYKGRTDKNLLFTMLRRFREISEIRDEPNFLGLSSAGIPHWIIEFKNLN